MSISDTVKKVMPYLKTASGYVLHRLSSQAVEMDDGTTLEQKVTSLNNLISQKIDSSDVVNNCLTTESGFVLDARQGKALDDKITELNGNLNNIKYEPIEDDHYYTKKYDNGYFESDFKTRLSPELGNPLTFQPLASGQTLFYRARITNMGIGIKATEIFSLELTAQNTGIIWPASPSMNANMAAVDTYVIQQGSDNTRTTTIRGRVTGKWK